MTSQVDRSIMQDFDAYAHSLVDVFDDFPIGVAIAFDDELADLRLNRRLRELMGLDADAVIGYGAPAELPYRCVRDGVELRFEELPMRLCMVAGQDVRGVPFELHRADGTVCHLVGSSAPLRDAAGTVRGALAVFGDTTAAHDAALQLQRSEEFNRKILASTQDCVKVVTLDGRLVSMNPNGAQALGIDDLAALLNESWLEFWHGTDRVAAEAALRLAGEGGVGRFTGFFATLRGEPRWWDVTVSPMLDAAGVPENLLIVSRDVSDRRRVEFENARRYQRERRVATSLQQASLPRTLPVLLGYAFDAVYLPGLSEAEIGGDWYDAFGLPDGRIGISIGDVTGSGLAAAVTMGRLRQAMRAAAVVDPDPATVLRAADFILSSDQGELLATALFAVLEPATGTLLYANAGHHAPLLARPDGRVTAAGGARGLPLGLRLPAQPLTEPAVAELQLAAGDLLVLFTDGLVESTRDLLEGERRLHAALAQPAVRAAPSPAAAIRDQVLVDGSRDDVAILTLTVAA